jgi:hypothetical protein
VSAPRAIFHPNKSTQHNIVEIRPITGRHESSRLSCAAGCGPLVYHSSEPSIEPLESRVPSMGEGNLERMPVCEMVRLLRGSPSQRARRLPGSAL